LVISRGEVHTSGEEAGELPLLPCLILCLLTSRRDCGLQVFDTGEMPITAHDRLQHEVEKMKYTVDLKFYSAGTSMLSN
jgi:hypothetical protein